MGQKKVYIEVKLVETPLDLIGVPSKSINNSERLERRELEGGFELAELVREELLDIVDILAPDQDYFGKGRK